MPHLRARRGVNVDRQLLDLPDARRVVELGVVGHDVVGQAAVQLLERDAQLEAGEVGAEAAVGAAAEGEVPVVLPVEVGDLGLGRRTRRDRCRPRRSSPSPCRPAPSARRASRGAASRPAAPASPACGAASAPRWRPAPATGRRRAGPAAPGRGRGGRSAQSSVEVTVSSPPRMNRKPTSCICSWVIRSPSTIAHRELRDHVVARRLAGARRSRRRRTRRSAGRSRGASR